MDMGGSGERHDGGHGTRGDGGRGRASGAGATGAVSVTSLIADPDRPADVRVELVARQETIDVPGGPAGRGVHRQRHVARARDPRAAGRPRRGRRS